MSVVTRFPPSPTGYLHVGGARTALFNWLYTQKQGGKMVLRIEDTDRERSTDEAVDVILDGMQWLGLDWDEGPHFQTQRFDRYAVVIQQLLDEGHAYYCHCSKEALDEMREAQMAAGEKPRYNGKCRNAGHRKGDKADAVIRFKNPAGGVVSFNDQVRGQVSVANEELDDLIIARSNGTPTYNLCVVVDDFDMGMTHVIRGDDHINNTPRQINILRALGAEQPVYAHVPMILGDDGQRLSKRHGAVSVLQYRDMGFLPEALLNYLVRLGWSYGDQEVFSREEMVRLFDISDVNRAPSSFNHEKLLWLNQHYIKEASAERLAEELEVRLSARGVEAKDGPALTAVADVLRDRAQTLEEMADQAAFWFRDKIEFDEGAAKKHLRPVAARLLRDALSALGSIESWDAESINTSLAEVLTRNEVKLPKLAQPLRVAVSGTAATPSIDITLELVGKDRTLERIEQALDYVMARAETA